MRILLLLAALLVGAISAPGVGGQTAHAPGPPIPDSLVRPSGVPGVSQAIVSAPEGGLGDRLRVVHWPGDEVRAERVIETLVRNPTLPGMPPGVPSTAVVFLTPDEERWDALTGGSAPHWGAGVAIPSRKRIVLPVHRTAWDGFRAEARTIRHEWAHLGLHEHLAGLQVPRWFDEGYAQWAAGGGNFEEAWRLRLVLAGDAAPPLDSLTLDWPRGRSGAEVAYLLSATAVEYLVRDSGAEGMAVFLSRWREMEDFEGAFRRTFGLTTGSFERNWIEYVKGRYGWVLLLGQSAVFWIFLGGALLLLFRIRRRRDRERLARLRAAEPPDFPAYWDAPPHPPIGGFLDASGKPRRPGAKRSPGAGSGIDRTVPFP